jgi:putative transposase
MIDRTFALKVSRHCELLALQRSTFYYKPKADHNKSLELMRKKSIHAIYRSPPRTSIPFKGHKIYPYSLKNLVTDSTNQVWATDFRSVWMEKTVG